MKDNLEIEAGFKYLNSLQMWKGSGIFNVQTTKKILEALGNPQDTYKTIHVGGTNGKGSTATFIASILAAGGNRVGLTVSPHLLIPEERIIVDGEQIETEILASKLILLKDLCSKLQIVPTYHEALTVCAFMIFQSKKVDYAVIEVGLGGRHDSSNVLRSPELVCITSLHYDHENVLGNTLGKIAQEKAGIFKPKIPVVLGKMEDEPKGIFINKSNELGSQLYSFGEHYNVKRKTDCFEFSEEGCSLRLKPILLNSEYQESNIGVAVKSAKLLKLSDDTIVKGVERAYIPGRFENVVNWNKSFVLDGAHNKEGVMALASGINGEIFDTVVFGCLSTKDWKFALDVAIRLGREIFLVEPNSEVSVTSNELSSYVSCFGVKSRNFKRDIESSLIEAGARTLVFGSLYLVGEVRKILRAKERKRW